MDLKWTKSGDFLVDQSGDLTTATPKEVVRQTIADVVKTTVGEWNMYPSYGSRVKLLFGRKIDQNLIVELKSAIRDAVIDALMIPADSLEIVGIPVKDSVYLRVKVKAGYELETEIIFNSDGVVV